MKPSIFVVSIWIISMLSTLFLLKENMDLRRLSQDPLPHGAYVLIGQTTTLFGMSWLAGYVLILGSMLHNTPLAIIILGSAACLVAYGITRFLQSKGAPQSMMNLWFTLLPKSLFLSIVVLVLAYHVVHHQSGSTWQAVYVPWIHAVCLLILGLMPLFLVRVFVYFKAKGQGYLFVIHGLFLSMMLFVLCLNRHS